MTIFLEKRIIYGGIMKTYQRIQPAELAPASATSAGARP